MIGRMSLENLLLVGGSSDYCRVTGEVERVQEKQMDAQNHL